MLKLVCVPEYFHIQRQDRHVVEPNPQCWWSITEEGKNKNMREKNRKQNQQNRLSWIQNEEYFIFLFLALFCLEMRCVPLKNVVVFLEEHDLCHEAL